MAGRQLMVAVVLLAMHGCGGPALAPDPQTEVVLVDSTLEAPSLLQSEVRQLTMPVRIDAPIRFENRGSQQHAISLSAKGCSCYGIATSGKLLEAGQQVNLPPGEQVELFFVGNLSETSGDQSFRAAFQSDTGVEYRVDCSLQVFPDLVVDPAVVVLDAKPAILGQEPEQRALSVIRVNRGDRPAVALPVFEMPSGLLTAARFEMSGAPESVGRGLWRATWRTALNVEPLPEDLLSKGGREVWTVRFPAEDPAEAAGNAARPKDEIPRISEVNGRQPSLVVEGQLLVRRSQGIVAPSQLHFGILPEGSKPRERRLVLTAADQHHFAVTPETVPDGFEVGLDTAEPADQQWITIRCRPVSEGDREGVLVLKSTHPEQPMVRILLKARIQNASKLMH